jgi:uncharacterized protein (DUF1697 family)
MKYIALLRGINAGQNRRVEMKKLKTLFELLGYTDVSTYLNSGNVIFESVRKPVQNEVRSLLKKEFGFDIPTLIKTAQEMQNIAKAIPTEWENDAKQRSDVAYLFAEIDSEKIIDELPFDKKFIDVRYTKGAVFWNVARENYNESHLNKLIGHKYYQSMTMRNVNTARFLGRP